MAVSEPSSFCEMVLTQEEAKLVAASKNKRGGFISDSMKSKLAFWRRELDQSTDSRKARPFILTTFWVFNCSPYGFYSNIALVVLFEPIIVRIMEAFFSPPA